MRRRYTALAAATACLAGTGQAVAGIDPATTVWLAGGSNLGECSAFLGTQQLRDDVNQIIRKYGDLLGISSPGALYHVRAQQEVNLAPAQECLPRNIGR